MNEYEAKLRDEFATAAMMALIDKWPVFDIGRMAYDVADAMLEARKK
jgi:hypothetical protein